MNRRASHSFALSALILLVGLVYWITLHPGVGDGDAAELQYCSPILGICHSPGYPFVVLLGNLFSMLPVGGDAAFRVNVMTAACAVAGIAVLYATLRRITGCVPGSLVGALTLAFSSVYWAHATLAEVYSFCGLLLLLAIYYATRFFQSGETRWFYLAALAMGTCVACRPSEILLVPAFMLAWLAFRKTAPLRVSRIAVAAAIAALPLVASLCFYFARENPALLHARDDADRDKAVGLPLLHEISGFEKFKEAAAYSLGLKWGTRTPTIEGQFAWDANKYAWLLSGFGAATDRFPEDDANLRFKRISQGRGGSDGLPAVSLAALGGWVARKQRGWLALGLVMFVANTAFYFWHHPPDNLEFTMPGLAGLALLVGIGARGCGLSDPNPDRQGGASRQAACAKTSAEFPSLTVGVRKTGPSRRRDARTPRVWLPWAALLAPAFLLAGNFDKITRADAATAKQVAERESLASIDWPRDSVIVVPYMRAMALRYVLHVRAGRTDIRVLSLPGWFNPEQQAAFGNYVTSLPNPLFLSASLVDAPTAHAALANTSPRVAEAGLIQMPSR